MGRLDLVRFPTSHIRELHLSDNQISDWTEVNYILKTFPNLVFLNLARNLLSTELNQDKISPHTKLSKVIPSYLNGRCLYKLHSPYLKGKYETTQTIYNRKSIIIDIISHESFGMFLWSHKVTYL